LSILQKHLTHEFGATRPDASKTLLLPFKCFAASEVAAFEEREVPGISILYKTPPQFIEQKDSNDQAISRGQRVGEVEGPPNRGTKKEKL
jgi:hypothetical protein